MNTTAENPAGLTADQWLRQNPFVLPVKAGHVYKADLFVQLGMNAARYRIEVNLVCESDPDFKGRYEKYRLLRRLPMDLAEIIIKRIFDNPNCTIDFQVAGRK